MREEAITKHDSIFVHGRDRWVEDNKKSAKKYILELLGLLNNYGGIRLYPNQQGTQQL